MASPEGLARELLLTILTGPHVLVLSSAILAELQRALSYPHLQAKWALPAREIIEYASLLQEVSVLADLPKSFPAVVRDTDDDLMLQTAIAGQADVLCSRDRAFQAENVKQICAAHKIRIVDDIALIRELQRG